MITFKKAGLCLAVASAVLQMSSVIHAEGEYAWPQNYGGVMLQGFYWDSFTDTKWTNLASEAGELSDYFDLIWIPNSGKSASNPGMGYDPVYWFSPNHNSTFGTEAELRYMISLFKQFNTGIIADVVVNHRSGVSTWTDFPTETYKGVTYSWGPWAICSNDEVANAAGQEKPTGAPDTGDNFDGSRDLDHTNAKVQAGVEAYLDCLLNDLGYTGFRYDMVKGYAPKYTGIYNNSAKPRFSVGEYWDGSVDKVEKWIDGTGKQSAAFDFPLKYSINNAFKSSDFSKLAGTSVAPAGLSRVDGYSRYAVTFIDNHDTARDEYGEGNTFPSQNQTQIVAANAYLLCSPGTPCVFLPHWKAYKEDLKKLIAIRKAVGVNNESAVNVLEATANRYVAEVSGTNGKLVIKVGRGSYSPSGYTTDDVVASNSIYSIWTKVEVGSLDRSHASVSFSPDGGYSDGPVTVTLTASNAPEGAKIAYTTDGSIPSATVGTQVESGATVNITRRTTLMAAVIADGGLVSPVKTAEYRTELPTPVVVYLEKPEWESTYFYAWADGFTTSQLLGDWPGTKMTETVSEKGKEWYRYAAPDKCYVLNLVFNIGSDQAKTVDVTGVEGTRYYRLDSTTGTGITVTDLTDEMSGVKEVPSSVALYVSPNPATDAVTIHTDGEIAAVEVFNASGATMLHRAGGDARLDVSALPAGFYVLRVALADGTTAVARFLKK